MALSRCDRHAGWPPSSDSTNGTEVLPDFRIQGLVSRFRALREGSNGMVQQISLRVLSAVSGQDSGSKNYMTRLHPELEPQGQTRTTRAVKPRSKIMDGSETILLDEDCGGSRWTCFGANFKQPRAPKTTSNLKQEGLRPS